MEYISEIYLFLHFSHLENQTLWFSNWYLGTNRVPCPPRKRRILRVGGFVWLYFIVILVWSMIMKIFKPKKKKILESVV